MSNTPKNEQWRGLNATGREDILAALRAAAQAKGSPLSDAEREAVYEANFPNEK